MAEKPTDSTLVIIPTYNEVENLPLIIGRVRESNPDVWPGLVTSCGRLGIVSKVT